MRQKNEVWKDLIEAEKRWLSSSISASSLGAMASDGLALNVTGSKRGQQQRGRSIQELLYHIDLLDPDRYEGLPSESSPTQLPQQAPQCNCQEIDPAAWSSLLPSFGNGRYLCDAATA